MIARSISAFCVSFCSRICWQLMGLAKANGVAQNPVAHYPFAMGVVISCWHGSKHTSEASAALHGVLQVVLDDVLERLPEVPNLTDIRSRAEEPSPYTMVALQAWPSPPGRHIALRKPINTPPALLWCCAARAALLPSCSLGEVMICWLRTVKQAGAFCKDSIGLLG